MSDLVFFSITTASLSAGALIVFEKIGFIEYLQLNASRFFGPARDLPYCNFCLLFWIGFLISYPGAAIAQIFFGISNIFYILTPFVSAPIAKAIYENNRASR